MELRQDLTTRSWILTGRRDDKEGKKDNRGPFCRGSEDLTPKTIAAFCNQYGEWNVRVFSDKSPVFHIEGNLDREAEGMFDKMGNIGAHELIVESPKHGVSLPSLSENEIEDILRMYRERVGDLKKDRRFKYIHIFKNHGSLASSAINHLHSHIVGIPVIPARMEKELRWAKSHYNMKGRCLYCDIIYQESKQKIRMAFENRDFTAFCPFASRFPYEVWILPRIHNHSFENNLTEGGIVNSLAESVKAVLSKIEKITDSYHIIFHISPNEASFRTLKGESGTLTEDFQWHIEILPRLERVSRLQSEEEFYINTITPEEAAKVLSEK